MVDSLVTGFVEKGKVVCLQWISAIIKINVQSEGKDLNYEPAKMADDAVIALPYDVPNPAPTVTQQTDIAAQQQGLDTSSYYKDDDSIM